MNDIFIREMGVEDMDDVLDVECASSPNPWNKDIFYQELVRNPQAFYYVILLDGKIVGYVGMWIVHEDAQITNIAVLPQFRGQKLGERLFRFSVQQAIYQGATRLSLEVRVSNVIAQNLYRKFGLVPGGIRKNYYTDNQEDAIVMWVTLS